MVSISFKSDLNAPRPNDRIWLVVAMVTSILLSLWLRSAWPLVLISLHGLLLNQFNGQGAAVTIVLSENRIKVIAQGATLWHVDYRNIKAVEVLAERRRLGMATRPRILEVRTTNDSFQCPLSHELFSAQLVEKLVASLSEKVEQSRQHCATAVL